MKSMLLMNVKYACKLKLLQSHFLINIEEKLLCYNLCAVMFVICIVHQQATVKCFLWSLLSMLILIMLYSLLGHKTEVLEKSMIHNNEVENKCETKKKVS